MTITVLLDLKEELDKRAAQIERLTERCAAYKGQVEAGAHEIERLRNICAATLTKLDTMHVCCRETACERASDEPSQDSSCDLRIVRGLLIRYQQEKP